MRSSLPKVLHPLCGRPLIAWPIAAAREAGAGKVVVVDGPERQLADHLPEDVSVAVQARAARGRATRSPPPRARSAAGDTVVIVIGDVPLVDADTLTGLVEAHEEAGAAATMLTAELEDPTGYGRVVRDAEGQVERVVETKATATRREAARDPRGQHRHLRVRRRRAARRAGAASSPPTPRASSTSPTCCRGCARPGARSARTSRRTPTVTLGVNDRVDLARVRDIAQRRINEAHMRAGVTIVDPGHDLIDAGVTIGADTMIEPSCVLRGATAIGEHVTIGPFTTLIDASVGDGATVLRAHLDRARVGAKAHRRPVRLPAPGRRPARARQGRHVRGDQELDGRRRQQGPAPLLHRRRRHRRGHQHRREQRSPPTTTAASKHRTTIGDRVRTSVDTTFVAPGDGRRRRLHRRRQRDHRRRARPARSGSHARARRTSRATRTAFPGGSGERADAVDPHVVHSATR